MDVTAQRKGRQEERAIGREAIEVEALHGWAQIGTLKHPVDSSIRKRHAKHVGPKVLNIYVSTIHRPLAVVAEGTTRI
jgi:hypothetical protein